MLGYRYEPIDPRVARCFDMCMDRDPQWGVAVDATGKVIDVMVDADGEVPEFETARQCVAEILKDETFPCLSDGEVWQVCVIGLI